MILRTVLYLAAIYAVFRFQNVASAVRRTEAAVLFGLRSRWYYFDESRFAQSMLVQNAFFVLVLTIAFFPFLDNRILQYGPAIIAAVAQVPFLGRVREQVVATRAEIRGAGSKGEDPKS